jgi:limonene 1,2-monooxygenase
MPWNIACEVAKEHGRTMDRSGLRLVVRMHLAETREEAVSDIRFGLGKYIDYANNNDRMYDVPRGADVVDWYVDQNIAVIGTPEDAIARIEALQAKQGQFGAVLIHAHNWADWPATKRSYELYARYVMPHFSGSNTARKESYEWVGTHRQQLSDLKRGAVEKMFEKHQAESNTTDRPDDYSVPL